jgi:putative transposase
LDFDELVRSGRIKRLFRAKRKITIPDIVSHITQRAAGKEPLFLEDTDYRFMLAQLKEISRKRSLDIYAFCLMPTHVHLLASPREGRLQEAMRDLFSRYAMRFNAKYMRKGHLFAGPYRQAVCLDDAYLLAASLYIHMNPVRAGFVSDPRDFRWSSVRVFHDPGAPKSFLKPAFILRLLGNNYGASKAVYLDLLMRSVNLDIGDAMEHGDAVVRFREALARIFTPILSKVGNRRHVSKQTGVLLLDEEQIEKQLTTEGLPKGIHAKRFLIQQLIARGYKRQEIADKLHVSVKTVYNILHTPDSPPAFTDFSSRPFSVKSPLLPKL